MQIFTVSFNLYEILYGWVVIFHENNIFALNNGNLLNCVHKLIWCRVLHMSGVLSGQWIKTICLSYIQWIWRLLLGNLMVASKWVGRHPTIDIIEGFVEVEEILCISGIREFNLGNWPFAIESFLDLLDGGWGGRVEHCELIVVIIEFAFQMIDFSEEDKSFLHELRFPFFEFFIGVLFL